MLEQARRDIEKLDSVRHEWRKNSKKEGPSYPPKEGKEAKGGPPPAENKNSSPPTAARRRKKEQ